MKRYLLVGVTFVSLIASIFFLPKIVSAGAKWPCSGIPGECEGWCDTICNQQNQCNPTASCKGGWCSCDCSGCDAGNDYGVCGLGGLRDCSEGGVCYECRDITAWVAGQSPPCQSTGAYEKYPCGSGGGTDSSCGNALYPGCSGWCASGSHCASDSGAKTCVCKPNHTCAEFLQPLHWPKIFKTSETTAVVYWEPYSEPARAADTLTIIMAPESVSKQALHNNCEGEWADDCVVNQQNIDPYIIGYINVTGMTPGTLYIMKAVYYPLGYVCGGREYNYMSSCTMSPDPLNILAPGQTGTLTSAINRADGQNIRASYESVSEAIATVTNKIVGPAQDTYTTTVTGVSNGSTTVNSTVKWWYVTGQDELHTPVVCRDEATVVVGTPTPTPTPTAIPSNPWIKLKNASYISRNNLDNPIPAAPVAYDVDDTTEPYFITGAGGVVSTINLGTNPGVLADNPEYKAAGLSPTFLMTPDSFLSYIKARKQSVAITGLGEISGPGIYIYEGADPLDINAPLSAVFNNNIVLLTTGTVNINTDFNPTGSVAIVADQIFFGNTVAQARGIFIANTINSGTASFGLKIIGNLIAQTSLSNNRTQTDPNQPAIFVVYDPVKYNNFYVDLLPYLSTANYDWRQIQ